MAAPLVLDRAAVLAFRRATQALDARLPAGPASVRQAAWAGLQDSVPRAALLAIHARVEAAHAELLDHPSLVQIWGPRYSTYVVAAEDLAVFTLGRLPEGGRRRRLAEDLAARLAARLGEDWVDEAMAARLLGEPPYRLRYAALTGRIVVRWDGARRPPIRVRPQPDAEPTEARRELARRYLHVFGPGSAVGFARWAGLDRSDAERAFRELEPSLVPTRSPLGDGWLLEADEPLARGADRDRDRPAAVVRLLPSGDPYTLFFDEAGRSCIVPDEGRRRRLWTPRVWPGAVLLRGEIVGTWRRAGTTVRIEPWQALARVELEAVEAEAASLPLPGFGGPIRVDWARP